MERTSAACSWKDWIRVPSSPSHTCVKPCESPLMMLPSLSNATHHTLVRLFFWPTFKSQGIVRGRGCTCDECTHEWVYHTHTHHHTPSHTHTHTHTHTITHTHHHTHTHTITHTITHTHHHTHTHTHQPRTHNLIGHSPPPPPPPESKYGGGGGCACPTKKRAECMMPLCILRYWV